jgi:hypothetical protein
VTECVVKPLRDVKVTGSKPAGIKNPTMLRVVWLRHRCDPRDDFNGLDAHESRFLKRSQQINKQTKKNSKKFQI